MPLGAVCCLCNTLKQNIACNTKEVWELQSETGIFAIWNPHGSYTMYSIRCIYFIIPEPAVTWAAVDHKYFLTQLSTLILTFRTKCSTTVQVHLGAVHSKTSVMPVRSGRANDNHFKVLINHHYTHHISFYMICEWTSLRRMSTLSLV